MMHLPEEGRHGPLEASAGPAGQDLRPALVDPMDEATRRGTVSRRLEIARRRIREAGASAWFTNDRANVAWLTAGSQHHIVTATEAGVAGLLIGLDRVWLVTPNIERARLLEEEFAVLDPDVVTVDWWDPRPLQEVAATTAGSTPLDDAAIEAAGLGDDRSVLDPADLVRMTVLGKAAEQAMEAALATVRPGMTEEALAAALLGALVGARAPVVLVAADDRIARFRHPLPTARVIERRVMLVLVAEAWGLHAALTRFVALEPDDDDIQGRWATVREVQRAMTEATRPGATLGDVFAAATAAYAAGGFPDEWRDHHQGGTIAYHGRERVATPGDPTVIRPGMAFAWNPSIAGVKVEDTFVLEADGARRWVTSEPH